MRSETEATPVSKSALYTGRFLTGLAALFLLLDGVMKVIKAAPVLEACAPLQIPEPLIPVLGIILTVATLVYLIPQTAILGAIIITGYLGGATWTHVRLGGPLFPMVFPSLVGALVWGGLCLREPRVRALFPLRIQPTVATVPAQG